MVDRRALGAHAMWPPGKTWSVISRAIATLVMLGIAVSAGASASIAQSPALIQDASHFSEVFGEHRNYRVFLPPNYAQSSPKRYPVVYFFHGSGERYNRPSAEV